MKTYTSPERKLKKVMVEKRRRMRIDRALLQMKHMVLEALNVQPEKYAKMEKADILDLTVRFLKKMRHERLCQGLTPAHQAPSHLPAAAHPFMPTAVHPMASMAAQPHPVHMAPRSGIPYYPTAFKAEIPSVKTESPQDLSYHHMSQRGHSTAYPAMSPYNYARPGPPSSSAGGPSTSGSRPRSHTLTRPISPIIISDSSSPASDPKQSPKPSPCQPISPSPRSEQSASSYGLRQDERHSPVAHAFVRVEVRPSTSRGPHRPAPVAAAAGAAIMEPQQHVIVDDMWRPW